MKGTMENYSCKFIWMTSLHFRYGSWAGKDVALAMMFYIANGATYATLQQICDIPHSNYKQVFGVVSRVVLTWADEVMQNQLRDSSADRNRIAQAIIRDDEFKHVGLIGDITDKRCWPSEKTEEREEQKSFK